ncbi:hypothetical protein FRB94_006178 [Tulasnella sp. JGI-2019a]|nr:hypothetical protein FRB94_006178 [Tulasnella sp. JGI-2019a]
MSSTEILFNSPALYSLKRTQLVKICKRHGLKATGTNEALIAKLQQFALNLPSKESGAFIPASDATTEEEDEGNCDVDEDSTATQAVIMTAQRGQPARPSDPWSMVEGHSREEENVMPPKMNSLRSKQSGYSLSTMGEFGAETSGLTKTSSLGSSIKAFASSLRRVASGVPASASVRSKASTSSFATRAPEPIRVQRSVSPRRPETPEPTPATYIPDQALGQSTVRLVPTPSSTLKMKITSAPSPSTDTFMVPTKVHDGEDDNSEDDWRESCDKRASFLYPQLPEFALATAAASRADLHAIMPDICPPSALSSPMAGPSTKALPLNLQSPATAATAASVLDEMNRRLAMAPNAPKAMTFEAFANKGPLFSTGPKIDWTTSGLKETKGGDRFQDAHEGMFNRMDSITSHYAAKRPAPGSNDLLGGKKRKSVTMGVSSPRRRPSISATPSAAKRRSKASMAVERKAIAPTPINKRAANRQPEASNSIPTDQISPSKKRVTIIEEPEEDQDAGDADGDAPMPGAFGGSSKVTPVVKPSEAAKKRLDMAKAKRRSSSGRKSLGKANIVGTGASTSAKPPSTGRFGFLKSSAKLVKSAWNAATGPKNSTGTTTKQATAPTPSKPPGSISTSRADTKLGNNVLGSALTKSSSFLRKKETPKSPEIVAAGASGSSKRQMIAATIAAKSPPPPPPSSKPPFPPPSGSNTRHVSSPSPFGKPATGTPLLPSTSGPSVTRRVASGSSTSQSVAPLGRKSGTATTGSTGRRLPLPTAGGGPTALGQGEGSARTSHLSALGSTSVSKRTTSSKESIGSGFGSLGAHAPAKPTGTGRSSTLTAPTASSLARLQSNIRPPTALGRPVQNQNQPPSIISSHFPSVSTLKAPQASSTTSAPSPSLNNGPLEPVTNTVNMDATMTNGEPESMTDFFIPLDDSSAPSTLNSNASGSRSGRRPRISRSKVIAKLGEKRAQADAEFIANTSATSIRPSAGESPSGGASALHVRRSHGVGAPGGTPRRRNAKDAEIAVLASAKKAVRRSEVVRRQSKPAVGGPGAGGPNWAGISAGFAPNMSADV